MSYNDDPEIMAYQSKIKLKKIELGKQRGEVFDSIDDVVCEHHPGSKLKMVTVIPESWGFTGPKSKGKALNVYECETCIEEKQNISTKAYDCPFCGIVLGNYVTKDINFSRPGMKRVGQDYYCKICDTKLGEHIWEIS